MKRKINELKKLKNQIEESETLMNLIAAILSNYKEDSINSDMCLIHSIFFEMKYELKLDELNNLTFDRIVYRFSRDLYDALYKLEKIVLSIYTINNESFYILNDIKALKEYYMSKFTLEEQSEIIKGSKLLNSKILIHKPIINQLKEEYISRASIN